MPALTGTGAAVPVPNFSERVYDRLAPLYDLVFGPWLQSDRRRMLDALDLTPGERVLEVGVGTGATLPLYPSGARVVGIDLSAPMLRRAKGRLDADPPPCRATLVRMHGASLAFAEGTFDVVLAPYVVNAVDQPVRLASEMKRVCRPGGRIVFLNHFRSAGAGGRTLERLADPLARHLGFRLDLDLAGLVEGAGLRLESCEPISLPRIAQVVVCRR